MILDQPFQISAGHTRLENRRKMRIIISQHTVPRQTPIVLPVWWRGEVCHIDRFQDIHHKWADRVCEHHISLSGSALTSQSFMCMGISTDSELEGHLLVGQDFKLNANNRLNSVFLQSLTFLILIYIIGMCCCAQTAARRAGLVFGMKYCPSGASGSAKPLSHPQVASLTAAHEYRYLAQALALCHILLLCYFSFFFIE